MLKNLVRRAFRGAGFDVRRYNPSVSSAARFMAMLAAHHINLIFDVGANEGQFAKELRTEGYKGRIVSFEPIESVWAKLKGASEGDPLWEVAPRGAVGAEDGEIEFHISANTVSSSALDTTDRLVKGAPQSAYVGTERLPLRRLDGVGMEYLRPESTLFIKIDTQGYEHEVLKGAPELLKKAVGIQLEVSLVPLYEKQCLYDEIFATMQSPGFQLWGFSPVFSDPQTGRLLQGDATFFRD